MADERLDFLSHSATEGEILADRLTRGRLPLREALRIAVQIGELLRLAHAGNRFHGDLSPSCVVLTESGARLLCPGSSPRDGVEPDAPSDILAFGALLYEMTAGRPPEDSAQQWERVPPPLRELLANLMDPDPASRRQRIHNAVIELRLIAALLPKAESHPAPLAEISLLPPAARYWRSGRLAAGAALLILLAGWVGPSVVRGHSQPGLPAYKFAVSTAGQPSYIGAIAVSPDGTQISFSAIGVRGQRMIWVRSLDRLHPEPVAGTEGGSEPFWSPDGRSIGFFADGSLKRVSAGGGNPSTLCSTEPTAGGGAWARNDTIVFAPGLQGGIYRVPAGGGTPDLLLAPDSAKGETAFRWPQLLDGGESMLFFARTGSADTTGEYIAAADGSARRLLLPSGTDAVAAGGFLLYRSQGNLVARTLDAARTTLKGEPRLVASDVGAYESLALLPVSVSDNGVLAYQSAAAEARELVWLARNGAELALAAEPGDYGPPRISPDGARIAVTRSGSDGGRDIWIVSESKMDRAAASPADREAPVWSPDGSKLLFRDEGGGLSVIDVNIGADASTSLVPTGAGDMAPTDWSRNGKYVLFDFLDRAGAAHVWAVSVGAAKARPIVPGSTAETAAAFSPDGKLIAYQAAESGTPQVFVQAFGGLWSDGADRRRVSGADGGAPRWSPDGAHLYYLTSAGDLMAVEVRGGDSGIEFAPPRKLFHTPQSAQSWNAFDVSPDGQRFIFNLPLEDAARSPVTILTSWQGSLGPQGGKTD